MNKHRFILQPYKGVATRHTCPACHKKRCFSRYIDTEKQISFPDDVGRCDHEQNCGYHLTPKEYFERNPQSKPIHCDYTTQSAWRAKPTEQRKPTSFIAAETVAQTLHGYEKNNLYLFLRSKFGAEDAIRLMKDYRVGTSKHWPGSCVFWQTDINGSVRTGKVMLYDAETGKRVKEPFNHVTWVHSLLRLPDFNLRQCFFGEHLLPMNRGKPVAIVESEACIFWQTDIDGNVRTGKVMLYNADTGKRVKEPFNHVTWVHSLLRLPDFNLRQCFFGEHLLQMNRGKPVAIVESEKTALVAAYYLPEYVWLASGGKNGCFNTDALRVLKGCQVILYPDIGATDQWQQKLSLLRNLCIEASIFNFLEEVATDNERTAGLDIADYLLQIEPDQAILQSMIRRNPILQKLIDDLQLTLVSVERYNPDTDAINKTSNTEKQ